MFKIKISEKKIIFYFYFLFLIGAIASLFFISSFLYADFYQVITQSEEILVLQREVVADDINLNKFEKVISSMENKNKRNEFDIKINF